MEYTVSLDDRPNLISLLVVATWHEYPAHIDFYDIIIRINNLPLAV